MANIYSQQGITETPVARIGEMSTASEARQSAKMFDAIQDNFERKAKEHQALAEKLYENGSKIAITQGLNELSRNPKYASNPEAFALEADKMAEKIYAQIDDPNMKTEVAMNYELKKNPYINRAYDNMYKMQNQQLEYQTLKSINEEMNDYGISVLNVINGTYGVDDIRKMGEAKKNFQNYLNAKDAQGFDLFTPHEKMTMENSFDKNVLNSFKNAYLNADEHTQEAFYNQIMSGKGTTIHTENGDIEMKPDSVISQSMLADIKNYVRDVRYKRLAEKEKEYKYGKTVALAEYMKDPTKSGLEQLKSTYPDLDEKTLDKLEAAYSESPNYMAETQAQALSMTLSKIDEIATKEKLMPDGTPDFDYQFKKLVEVNEFINRQSTGKDAKLGYEDVQMLRDKAAEAMINEEERKLRMETSNDAKSFSKMFSFFSMSGAEDGLAYAAPMISGDIDIPLARNTAKNTIYLAEKALSDKTVPPEKRVENAKNIYRVGKERLIRIRNPEIGDKQVGDKYTINGITYEIVSFDNYDVQARVVK